MLYAGLQNILNPSKQHIDTKAMIAATKRVCKTLYIFLFCSKLKENGCVNNNQFW
jgi:hypothetical protein